MVNDVLDKYEKLLELHLKLLARQDHLLVKIDVLEERIKKLEKGKYGLH